MQILGLIILVAILTIATPARSQESHSELPTEASKEDASLENSKSVYAHTSHMKLYNFMKDVVGLSISAENQASAYQYTKIPGIKVPTLKEIEQKISEVLQSKLKEQKIDINVVIENNTNFKKRDPIKNAILNAQVNYKIYKNGENEPVLVGVISPILKRLNPLKDSRSEYLMLPSSTVIFFLNNDNEKSQKSLDEAIDKLTSSLIVRIIYKH